MGISKRMLIGTAVTGGLYFIVGEALYQKFLGKIAMPFLIGLYFLGLMIFVIIGLTIIGSTMTKTIGAYKDIVRRCILLCVTMMTAGCLFEFIYEFTFRQHFTSPTSYIYAMDNSGSMNVSDPENKRYNAIQATLENKNGDFSFVVYSFADDSKIIRSMGSVSEGTEFKMEEANGGTAIKTVLKDIYEDIDKGELNLGKNGKVLLFSDGAATDIFPFIGKASLNRILEKYSKKGISISTVGLGYSDDKLMEMIARKTGGIYVKADDPGLLEKAMEEAIDSTSDRNLLDYRSPVRLDFFLMLFRFLAVLLLGLLLALVKMYICEPFLDTLPLWVTSVICSLLGAACVELGMNKLGLQPQLMRFLMCVLLAEGTLLKTKPYFSNDFGNRYRNY